MKKLSMILFLFLTLNSFGQSKFKINLTSGLNYSFTKYTYNDGFTFDEEIDFKMPLGYSINTEIEYQISENTSMLTGLRFKKYNIHPRLALPWSYGTQFELDGETVWMSTPYLAKHEIKTLSIPLVFKRHFNLGKRISYFALMGVEAGFQFDETETYLDRFQGLVSEDNPPAVAAFNDDEIQLFNTSIEIGVGLSYRISNSINLLFQTSANVLDFRKGNEKFKKNGDMIWEDTFLPIGQASLGLGIQKEF